MAEETIHQRLDGWQNTLTGLGLEGKDHRLAGRHRRGRRIEQQEIDSLYEESWLFSRIVDAVAEHSTRRWLRLTIEEEEGVDDEEDRSRMILDRLEELDAPSRFYELMKFDRMDGGSAMLLGANDGQRPDQPLNLEKISEVAYLNVLRRHEIRVVEVNQDPTTANFLQPEYYQLNTSTRVAGVGDTRMNERIHWSRVIRLVGIPAGDWSPYRDEGWGVPMIQRIFDDTRQFETLYGYLEAAFKDTSQGVMGIKDLNSILVTEQGNMNLIARMRLINMVASAFNMVLLDSEGEKYEKRGNASFGGISDVVLRFMDKIAAASEIPLSILFGSPPTGLSTDNEAGKRSFYDSIANKQRRLLTKPVNRVIECLLAEEKKTLPKRWQIEWLPLEEPNEKEIAERRKVEADTDIALVDAGIITEQEARSRYLNDPRTPYVLDMQLDLDAEQDVAPEPEQVAKEFGLRDPIPEPVVP